MQILVILNTQMALHLSPKPVIGIHLTMENQSMENPGGVIEYVTTDVKTVCGASEGVFKLLNVQFELHENDYDVITNQGTPTVSGGCIVQTDSHHHTFISKEKANSPAYISYSLAFPVRLCEGDYYDTTFEFILQNDVVELNPYDPF